MSKSRGAVRIQVKTIVEVIRSDIGGAQRDKHRNALVASGALNIGGGRGARTEQDLGDRFMLDQGFTLVWVGWQFDVNAGPNSVKLYAPVLAGVTSLNVDALWESPTKNGQAPEYLRAVPTGPLAPLVVAATSSGNALALGLSYRRSAFTAAKVATIGSFVADCVCSLQ